MKQININALSETKYDILKNIAEDKGLPVSTLCRVWVLERLNEEA